MDKQSILNVATTLHAVFCPLNHEDDVMAVINESDKLCNWYVESDCENPWSRPAHQLWMLRATLLIRTLATAGKSIKEIEEFVLIALEICRKVLDLRMINEDAESQLVKLLCDYYGGD